MYPISAINSKIHSPRVKTLFIVFFLFFSWAHPSQARVNIDVMLDPQNTPILTGPTNPLDPDDWPDFPQLTSANAAIVIDQATGEVLAFLGPDKRTPMASTTKIMTALLVLEQIAQGSLQLTTMTTVSWSAGTMGDAGMGLRSGGTVMGSMRYFEGQDSSAGLSPGDTVSIQDLLYGLLLGSANDAAIALAEAAAGSEKLFVERMNQRATQLGMGNTWYANPHGRDPNRISSCPIVQYKPAPCAHYSSARDIATLTRMALDIPLFSMIVGTEKYRTTNWSARFSGVVNDEITTTNRFLRDSSSFYKPNVFGVKTGTTKRAGRCLVSAADSQNNSYDSVIAVVLGTSYEDGRGADRYTDSALMLDYGLSVLESRVHLDLPHSLPTNVAEMIN